MGQAPRRARLQNADTQPGNTRQSEEKLLCRVQKLEDTIVKLGGLIESGFEGTCSPTANLETSADGTQPSIGPSFSQQPIIQGQEGDFLVSDQGLLNKFGRLSLHASSDSKRYISDGFWAKLDQELSSIHEESPHLNDDEPKHSDISDDLTSSLSSTSFHPHIFGYNSIDGDPDMCLTQPSHVPFLWLIYQENVEPLLKAVHVPTMEHVIRDARKNFDQLVPSYQALVLAIYYAAVVSLDPEDVLSNLGQSKDEALAKYRFAVQQALSRANFLTNTNTTVVQALLIFLAVVKHQDGSRFCWSLTGLVIHLARGMGFHRDGSHLGLSPFETELRRRIWWGLMNLDLRSAEELGTELVIGDSTFDTQMPSNVNDLDINPEILTSPDPREGRSDTTLLLVRCEICSLSRRIIEAASASSSIEEQNSILAEVYRRVDQKLLKWIHKKDPLSGITKLLARSVRAKICFVIYQPMLVPVDQEYATQSSISDEARQCVYAAAINLIEHDHILNVDIQCQQYRWLLQTFKHWHAIAYFLIESCRRPWTPLSERGWQAFYGYKQHDTKYIKSMAYESALLPIRKLSLRVIKHRTLEIARLKENPEAAYHLDDHERTYRVVFPFGEISSDEDRIMNIFRARWKVMVRSGNLHKSTENTPQFTSQTEGKKIFLFQPIAPGSETLMTSETTSSIDGGSCRNSKHLSVQTPKQPAEPILDMSRPFNSVDWSELIGASIEHRKDITERNNQDENLYHDTSNARTNCGRPQWPSHDYQPAFSLVSPPAVDQGFDALTSADIDMFADHFNWKNWAEDIRDLEAEKLQGGYGFC